MFRPKRNQCKDCRQIKNNATSAERSRRYREHHREERNAASRKYFRQLRQEHPEKETEYNRRAYLKHREKRVAYAAEYENEIKTDPKQLAKLRGKQRDRHNRRMLNDETYRDNKRNSGRKTDAKRYADPIKRKKRNSLAIERRHKDLETFNQRKRDKYKKNPELTKVHNARRRTRKRHAEGKYTKAQLKSILRSQSFKCYWCKADIANGYHPDHFIPLARGGTNWPENIVGSCGHCNDSKLAKMPGQFWRELQNWSTIAEGQH